MVSPRMPKGKPQPRGKPVVGEDPTRIVLPNILNDMNLHGHGAEIGVFKGWHSKLILDNWKPGFLYAVDPWIQAPMFRNGVNIDPVGHGWRREKLMQTYRAETYQTLKPHMDSGRCVIIPLTSAEASKQFEPDSLDWVFIDGRHYREGVLEDLECWYPLVKRGGVVSGHDYVYKPRFFFEVKPTVDEFFKGIENVQLIPTSPTPSWFFVKGYPDETGTRPIGS